MSESHTHRHNSERRLLWALLLISGFMLVEVVGGILSGSLALLADAGHMLTDAASLLLAWGAARTARRPADALRTYGYHRIQILAALLNGLAFILLVGWITYEAVQRMLQPVEVMGGMMLVVAVLGLLVNIAAFAILHGGARSDLNLRGAVVHVLGDLLGSVAAIVAAGVILLTGWMPIDPLLSLLVALLILRSAWYVVKSSAHILLEGTPEDVDVELLRRILSERVPAVVDVHHVHVWSLTPERPLLTLHVTVAEEQECAAVLAAVKTLLRERFGITHSTVQVEAGECADH
ncbi:MAG: cation diffusion facilitator family transporter [Gammaproteobacteria bacterium]|nr:cation diffusion facilitator family transporter [Gammaproteobacteria bacterium]MCW8972376.1 cation diffusion facilitator family transporter [Gammaproteobacteria bacterium]MCW8992626.1 cation diffusion facilitator family transporter [Gammaproteobacteria bacterium]